MLDDRYLDYSVNNKGLFYSEPNRIDKPEDRLSIASFSSDDWIYTIDADWIYMLNKNEQNSPDQGWKIHITAVPMEAQEELYAVSKYLINNNISFKFIPTIDKLIDRNSKNANRASSGKFITVYPHDTKIFIKLLDDLHELTKFYNNGPYILNDKQWKNGNVFFRYGGFKEMTMIKDGKKVDAIKDPSGKLIPDKRVPYYYLPEFVKEPMKIQENNKAVPISEYKELKKYKIVNAISFSDAGGVYKASINNRTCILKEGRPEAGLDSKETDGFYRVLHEYRVLDSLKDNPFVVNVNNYFTAWKHNYLEENFIKGMNLDDFIAIKFPFNIAKTSKKELQKYITNIKFIISELLKAIKSIHAEGVAIGDLQPSNVIFSEKEQKITLIDFEAAQNPNTKYEPGIMTLGFVSNNADTYGEADWYAVGKIALYLLMPIETANSSLSPKIEEIYYERIKTIFGDEIVEFLENIKLEISKYTNVDGSPLFIKEFLKIPNEKLSKKTAQAFVNHLRQGIVNNLDFQSKGLIKGDIKQYRDNVSRYAISYGAFGGIMTLIRSGGIPDEIVNDFDNWLSENCAIISSMDFSKENSYGLFDGLAGICSVLYDLGETEKATSLLKKISLSNVQGVSIYSGVSGIGMVFLAGYLLTQDNQLLKKCYEAADIVEKDFLNRTSKPVKNVNAGLLNGLAGEALFLYKVGQKTGQTKYKSIGIEIIDYVIKYQLKYDQEGSLYIIDTSRKVKRAIPYLNDGAAGVAVVMISIYQDKKSFLNNKRKKILQDLISTTFCISTVEAGLLEGYAGFLVLGTLVNNYFSSSDLMNYILDGLNMYLFSNGTSEVYVPGATGLKCSMDVSTGASGIILALLGVIKKQSYAFLPLPIDANIF